MKTDRMAWVDMAKGLSIILVVMMYAAYNTGKYTGETGFLHYVIGFATPFRMPEFFLISGLFLSQVIARPWRRFADRRVVHYFYFYALWAFIMIALKEGIYARSPAAMAGGLGLAVIEPYGVLWFIYMLGVFGFVVKLLWQWRVSHMPVLALAAALQMTGIDSASYAVTQFCGYFVFFYAGYAAAPLVFAMVDWMNRHVVLAIAALVAWALLNGALVFSPGYAVLPQETRMGLAAFPPLHLGLAIAGSCALCILGALLSRLWFMDWLRWLGEHSLVVYLAFTLPMSMVRAVALNSGLITHTGLLSLIVLVAATSGPVILYLIVGYTGYGRFLFERPAWARIVAAQPPVATAMPAPAPARPASSGHRST